MLTLQKIISYAIILLSLGACFGCGANPPNPKLEPYADLDLQASWQVACQAANDHYDPNRMLITSKDQPEVCDWGAVEIDSFPGIAAIGLHPSGALRVQYGWLEMSSLQRKYGFWVPTFIFAHEIGHGLDFQLGMLDMMNPYQFELSADEWGGCILAWAGARPSDMAMLEWMAIDILNEGKTHPGYRARTAAMARGYKRCSKG